MKLFSKISTAVVGAAALAVAMPAAAQDEAAGAKVKATHGAWEVRCADETQCSMNQTFKDGEGRPVLAMFLQKLKEPKDTKGGKVIALARIVTPLNVLLPSRLGMRVDGGDVKQADFIICTPLGCEARPQVHESVIEDFKAGAKLEFLTAVPTADGPKVIVVDLSLTGFGDAFNEL